MVGGQGNPLVPVALFGWIPFVSWLFSKVTPRTAAAIAFALAWMFLPVAAIPLKGIPDYTKVTATCIGIFLAAWIYDKETLLSFKLKAVDIPMVLWCSCPFFSSVVNGLGAYDGLSTAMYETFTWGLPYFVARIYFSNLDSINILAVVIFLGGLLYIPFCFVEMVMSPQLHNWIYGYHQHSILQAMRGGGWRPMVFMEHGLMVAMWMVSASMTGLWLGYAKVLPKYLSRIPFGHFLAKYPFWLLLAAQIVTTLLMKSTGAFVLFFIGLATLYLSNKLKISLLVWFLIFISPIYMVARSTGYWTGESLTQKIEEKFSAERAQSLQFRFDNEKILVDKALDGTFFGWGGWNRSRVFDKDGKDISVTDGLWIITLGTKGIYGLTLLTIVVLLPALMLLFRAPPSQWNTPRYASIAVMSMLLILYMIDNLLNAMLNPIFMLFNGAIVGTLSQGVPQLTEEADRLPENMTRPARQTRFLGSVQSPIHTRFITGKKE